MIHHSCMSVWFQVLIGILTIELMNLLIQTKIFVSSPYRYSNNSVMKMFQVLIGILTIVQFGIINARYTMFQVLIGILTILIWSIIFSDCSEFQVLIGILTMSSTPKKRIPRKYVSSPYRYSNNVGFGLQALASTRRFQVLIGILTI